MRHPGALTTSAYLVSLTILAAQTPTPGGTSSKATPPPRAAVLVSKGDPDYTAEAKAAGLQGTVTLYVEVGLDGRPRVVHVLEGLGLGLDEKAVEAVKQWQYRPGQQGPADGVLDIREEQVQFRLPDAGWRVSSAVYWYVAPPKTPFREIAKPVLSTYHAPDAAACATSGATVVGFLIDRKGLPQDIQAVRGNAGALGDAALKAVASWQFRPAQASGKAVEEHAEVTLQCGTPPSPAIQTAVPGSPAVSPPSLHFKREPEYSEEARVAKTQGSCLLSIRITTDGEVADIRVLRPIGKGLDEKAMEAVKNWRFMPGRKDGQPVSVLASVEVNFRLL